MGRRLADGVAWRWFCSPACVHQHKREHLEWREKAAEGRHGATRAQWRAELHEEVESLTRYGVPRAIAWAVLARLAERFRQKGTRQAFYRYVERRDKVPA